VEGRDDTVFYLHGAAHFYNVKITHDVRRYDAEHDVSQDKAIKRGLQEKAKEFANAGELYQKV